MEQKRFDQISSVLDYTAQTKSIDPINRARGLLGLIVGAALSLATLIATIAIMISNYTLYISSMSLIFKLIVWLIVVGIPLFLFCFFCTHAIKGAFRVAHEVSSLSDRNAERKIRNAEADRIRAEAERIRAEAMVCMRSIPFDSNGNAAIIGVDAAYITQLYGQYPSRIGSTEEQKLLNEANESIPEVVYYDDVKKDVPPGMSLLGIHPQDGSLEVAPYEKLKCLWIVGSSSTGKSNTVFGKVREAVEAGAKLLVIDQHAAKEDGLARKLQPYERAFLRPVAVSDEEVLATLAYYKREFDARVDGASCEQKIVLIADEMNRMDRNERLKKALKEIVCICGEEARGFGMYGWFLSQKAAGLKWLRDSAITVIVHRLTSFREAWLACNEDRNAARELLKFRVGRTYIYGVDFDEPMVLQQARHKIVDDSVFIPELGTSKNASIDEVVEGSTVVYFSEPMKRDEVANTDLVSQAQNENEKDPRMEQVMQAMLEGKSVNKILAEIWGITSPGGGAYQSALIELREVQKAIAKRAM